MYRRILEAYERREKERKASPLDVLPDWMKASVEKYLQRPDAKPERAMDYDPDFWDLS